MGHAIAKVATEAWHGIKKGAKIVGHAVEKGADDVYHVGKEAVDEVGTLYEKAADIATTVVVDVGGVAQHVVSIIPGIGGTLSNGLAGVMDLAKKYDEGVHDVVEIIKNPAAAVHEAIDIVTHPSLLKSKLEDVANLVKGVSGDVMKVVVAAAALTPEGAEIAPELVTLANVGMKAEKAATLGSDLLSGNVAKALHDGMGFLPKNAQALAKAVTASVDVATDLKKGDYNAALKAATPFLPAKAQKGLATFQKLVDKKAVMEKALVKVAGQKRARQIMQVMHSSGNMAYAPVVHTRGTPYMLAFKPRTSVEALHHYFQQRHPNQEISYHVFLPNQTNGKPEWQATIYT